MAVLRVLGTFLLIFTLVHAYPPDRGCNECPTFWTRYGDSCYRFFGTGKTWNEAEEHCQGFFTRDGQGHLASVHSEGENDFLIQLWRSSLVPNDGPTGTRVWIGLSDQVNEDRFAWSDGTSVNYRSWTDGQPNDGDNGEDCVEFWPHGPFKWNDRACSDNLPYICKLFSP